MANSSTFAKDLKGKSIEDLTKVIAEKRESLRALRFSGISRSVKDTAEPKKTRADIARAMTELHARRMQAQASTELGTRKSA